MSKLSHLDEQGKASMVDVSAKSDTERLASAEAVIVVSQEAFDLVTAGEIKKGDLLVASEIKGVATAMDDTKYKPGCIIGKALEKYSSDEVGTIEVAVGKN